MCVHIHTWMYIEVHKSTQICTNVCRSTQMYIEVHKCTIQMYINACNFKNITFIKFRGKPRNDEKASLSPDLESLVKVKFIHYASGYQYMQLETSL